MISKEGQNIIRNLIHILHEAKGPAGTIRLTVAFDNAAGNNNGTRGIISPTQVPIKCESSKIKEESTFKTSGVLPVGSMIKFSGLVSRSGFLHLFNLGTSGTCVKLAPSAEHANNRVSPNDVFEIPSARLANIPLFKVTPPTTIESGERERLLAILTQDDIDLQCTGLHPRLINRDVLTHLTRGPGFFGPVGASTSQLLQLDKDRWEYGLVELEVVPS